MRVNCKDTWGQQTSWGQAIGASQQSLSLTGAQLVLVCPHFYHLKKCPAPPCLISQRQVRWILSTELFEGPHGQRSLFCSYYAPDGPSQVAQW